MMNSAPVDPKVFAFPCRTCGHSATQHSSKTGPRDMRCHLDECGCEKYGSWALDALKRSHIRRASLRSS